MDLPSILESSLLVKAVNSVSEGITIADPRLPDCPLVYVNPGFEKLTGYCSDEIIGQNCRFLQQEDKNQPDLTKLRESVKYGKNCRVIIRNYKKSGEMFWNELCMSPVFENHTLAYLVGIQKDITIQKQFEERILYLSEHDHLTDLYNHRAFYERGKQLCIRAEQQKKSLLLIATDLNGFKAINDEHGHLVGDNMLRQYAQILRSQFDDAELIARNGGDEFLILKIIQSADEQSDIIRRLDELNNNIKEFITQNYKLSASYGYHIETKPSSDCLDNIFVKAEAKMYKMKQNEKA